MAYPTIDKPYGLKPINLIGGQVFAGATRQRRIASSASSIGYGDPLEFDTDGTVKVTTSTTTPPTSGFAGNGLFGLEWVGLTQNGKLRMKIVRAK